MATSSPDLMVPGTAVPKVSLLLGMEGTFLLSQAQRFRLWLCWFSCLLAAANAELGIKACVRCCLYSTARYLVSVTDPEVWHFLLMGHLQTVDKLGSTYHTCSTGVLGPPAPM